MIQNLKKAIMTSISEVLETMLFMAIEFDDENSLDLGKLLEGQSVTGCTLDFRGILTGVFILLIPDEQLHAMAADFMGTDPDKITDEHDSGTIKEITNMIAGNTFSLYDDKKEFMLGIPELVEKKNIENVISREGSSAISIKVKTEDSFIAVKVIIQ